MKMTVEQHFTMFSTIAEVIRSCTNLNEEQTADFAANITTAITENLGIEVEMTEKDNEFIVNGLLMALIEGLM
jgi:hypothetical protein